MMKNPAHITEATSEREKRTIQHMFAIYCRGHRHAVSGVCADCESILRYTYGRIEICPYNASTKPVCGLCRSNCFTSEVHQHFTKIMRYAGPRMLVRHPILTMAHVWDAVQWERRG